MNEARPRPLPTPAASGRGARTTLPLQILAVCALVAMVRYAGPVLLPTVIGLLLFYMLDPVVAFFARRRVPRFLAAPVVVCGLISALGFGLWTAWPQVESVVAKVPAAAAQARRLFLRANSSPVDSPLERVKAAADAVDSAAAAANGTPAPVPGVTRVEIQQPVRVLSLLWTGGMGLITFTGQAVAVLFLTIFLLVEGESFKRKLVARMDGPGSKRVTVEILNDINAHIGRFIWVQLATSSLVAVITSAALWALGLESPIVWGLVAGVMNIVPYFGALIVTVLLAGVALVQFGNIVDAAVVAGVSLAITTFEGWFLTPHLLSRAASINHVSVFLGIAFWSWIWGVPGMLLAVPILMVVKSIADRVQGFESVSTFLSR